MNRWTPILIVVWAALSVPAGAIFAAEAPTRPPAGIAPVPGEPAPPDNTWLDRTHAYLEEDLFATVTWFDHFFEGKGLETEELPESTLRWTNELRWDQKERFQFRTRVRAGIRLPHLARKWRLVISGETRGDPTAVKPQDPGNPGLDDATQTRRGSTELVYDLLRTRRTAVDFGAGVRVKIPPDAFVRVRLQHARELAFATLGRLTLTPFWDARDGFGESNQLDFERPLSSKSLLRWGNSVAITEKSNGWTWGTELSLLVKLSPTSAVTFAGSAAGPTRPATVVRNYRVYTRYRRGILRPWFFCELEPDVNWPKPPDGGRTPIWGSTLRLEILFAGTAPP